MLSCVQVGGDKTNLGFAMSAFAVAKLVATPAAGIWLDRSRRIKPILLFFLILIFLGS
jgi:predicted MFS family arabinose efflux permease